jgi:ribosome biogenesis protein UTP30
MVASTLTSSLAVNPELMHKAVTALLKHHNDKDSSTSSSSLKDKKANLLFGSDVPIHVQFTLSKVPEKTSPRPIRVPIPHPLFKIPSAFMTQQQEGEEDNDNNNDDELDEVTICLIVKDDSKAWVKDLIEKVTSSSSTSPVNSALSTIKKVLTLTSLRKKFSQYKDRRELCKTYDLFMADERILPMLGKALGKNFFAEKKQPIPLKLTRREALPTAIHRNLMSTFMFISPGTCITVKSGSTAMKTQHLLDNIQSVIEHAIDRIPRKWANVSAIGIKTSTSMSLPIYNKSREELIEIAKLAKVSNNAAANKREREDDKNDIGNSGSSDGNEAKKQKKDVTKSPLLKALKKQMKTETSAEKVNAEENKSKTPNKKKRSNSISGDEKVKNHKKEDAAVDTKLKTKTETPKSSKKQKKEDTTATVETKSKTITETPKTSKKQLETKEKSETTNDKFIPSKKFQGAKKGYVFKKDKNGIGYYVDIKPVVDKSVLSVLSHTGGRRNSSGGNKGKKGGRYR